MIETLDIDVLDGTGAENPGDPVTLFGRIINVRS